MIRRSLIPLFICQCIGSACSPAGSRRDTTATGNARAPAPVTPSPWAITPRGLGPLHAGMTRAQAESVLGGSLSIGGDTAWKDCAYASTDRLPPGVRVMVEGGSIARIDVERGTIATAEGAAIGDSEDRVRQLYAGRVVTSPHKYTNGHYLTVKPTALADSSYRMVFETDGQRVTVYRAGRVPQVEYVERCG
jgi:hypothetical protein